MSGEELQDDQSVIQGEVTNIADDNAEFETETESELAPDSDAGHEKKPVTFDEDQQKLVNEIIAKKTFKQRDAERQAAALKAELDAIKARQIESQAPPAVTPMPDQFSENFEQQLAQREEDIRKRAIYEQNQAAELQRIAQERQLQEQQKQAELAQKVDEYSKKALNLGVKREELAQAHQAMTVFGINDQLQEFIADDDQGGLIAKYISLNPQVMEAIAGMNPIKAAAYIESNVKPKVSSMRPKTTNAPDPVRTPRGAGADREHPLIRGATFE